MSIRRLLLAIVCVTLTSRALADDAPAPAESWKHMTRLVAPILDRDPLGNIAKHMGKSADLLGKLDTDVPTQTVQKSIVLNLDEFIAMLEKRKKNGKSGSGANPSNPLPDSILAKGPGGEGDLKDPNASARLWGQLPPKQRQQILQSQTEGFPPGYESVLSSYYKRLAQEDAGQPATAIPQTGVPSTRPSAPAR